MGDPESPRYQILSVFYRDRALSYSHLQQKSRLAQSTFSSTLRSLIEERIVIKWYFGGRNVLYAHCFIPWYEVKEKYEEKYALHGHGWNEHKVNLRKKLEKVLS